MPSYQTLLIWAAFGLVIGIVAKLIMPGRDPGGPIFTFVLGIVGALVGNFLYAQLTGDVLYLQDSFSVSGVVIAVVGAFLLLLPCRLLAGSRKR